MNEDEEDEEEEDDEDDIKVKRVTGQKSPQ